MQNVDWLIGKLPLRGVKSSIKFKYSENAKKFEKTTTPNLIGHYSSSNVKHGIVSVHFSARR